MQPMGSYTNYVPLSAATEQSPDGAFYLQSVTLFQKKTVLGVFP